jgi:hypothetical protein
MVLAMLLLSIQVMVEIEGLPPTFKVRVLPLTLQVNVAEPDLVPDIEPVPPALKII